MSKNRNAVVRWSLFCRLCGSVWRPSGFNALQLKPGVGVGWGRWGPRMPPSPYLFQTPYLPPSLPSVSSASLQADRPDTNTGLFWLAFHPPPPPPPAPPSSPGLYTLAISCRRCPTAVAHPELRDFSGTTPTPLPNNRPGSPRKFLDALYYTDERALEVKRSVTSQLPTPGRTCPRDGRYSGRGRFQRIAP